MVVPQLKFELLLGASSDKQTKAVIEAALEDTLNKLEETEEDKYLGQTPLEVCASSEGNVVYIYSAKEHCFNETHYSLSNLKVCQRTHAHFSTPRVPHTTIISTQGNAEIAGLLLDKGADPNHTNNVSFTN